MYCPKCNQEQDGKFCLECGSPLIEKPASQGGLNLNFGDANAISGGLNVNASKNIHNEDKSVHNITNNTSTVNNITNVAAQKTQMELLQERKNLYLNACMRAYEDNILEQDEKLELDRYRIELQLDEGVANGILEQVQMLVIRHAQKSELTGVAKTKLKRLTESLNKNEITALVRQLESIEVLVDKFSNEELHRKYYLVLAALKENEIIEKFGSSTVDNYWQTYWCCLAYQKIGKIAKSEELLFSLENKYPNHSNDNITLLAVACAYMRNDIEEAKELLNDVVGDYPPGLQRFAESLYLLLDAETAKEMGATEQSCAFYLVNFFNKNLIDEKNKYQEDTKQIPFEAKTNTLKAKWESMACEGFRMMNELDSESEDFVSDMKSVLNMIIPPAIAEIPYVMTNLVGGLKGISEDEAVKWADKLMALNPQNEDADVMLSKGVIYSEGVGHYTQNIEYALAFYRAAAEKGNMDAMCSIAELFFEGEKIEKNYQLALEWAKSPYEAKNAYGLYLYGVAYYEGKGLPKDTLKGKRIIREAANTNNSIIGSVSAMMYLKENKI